MICCWYWDQNLGFYLNELGASYPRLIVFIGRVYFNRHVKIERHHERMKIIALEERNNEMTAIKIV